MSRNAALRASTIVVCLMALLGFSVAANGQTVDATFNPGANQVVWSLAQQPDGKILVAGSFTALGGGTGTTTRNHIGRLNLDGSVDSDFNPGANSTVETVAVQPDGKILIGGNFTSVGGGTGLATVRNHVARLNSDGSVDVSFDPGANNVVYALVVQADGKILVGGSFTTLGGGGTGTTTRRAIGRLNENGTVDSFDPGASKVGGAPIVYTMALQPDRMIVVGGYFQGLGGGTGVTPRNYIGRLDENGAVDALFDPGATFYVSALALQSDGAIIAGGNFIGLGGGDGSAFSRLHIGRLNSSGTVDLGFNPGTEAEVHTLGVQVDGKILAGGYFKWMGAAGNFANRSVRNYIGRLNPDGTVDSTFNPGADNIVEAVLIQPDGAIVAGGHFLHVGDGTGLTTARNDIARFPTTVPAVQNLTLSGGGSDPSVETWMRSGAGPEVIRVTFEFSFDGSFFSLLGAGVRVPGGWQLTSVNLPLTRRVYLRARGYYGTGFQNGAGSIVEAITIQIPPPPQNGDYNGDGVTDLAVFRPSTGDWHIVNTDGASTVALGSSGDIPVPGDYDGDGKTDEAVFQPNTATWYILKSAGPTTPLAIAFGLSTDIPVPADYDGDGRTDLAVYRPSLGTWLIRYWSDPNNPESVPFGSTTDVPVPADYDGDGRADVAIYRPSAGDWVIVKSGGGGTIFTAFGASGDLPIPADYDGDGKADIAVYRPANGNWYILRSTDSSFFAVTFGFSGDIPMPGDYDGDGAADIVVYRPSTGTWFILESSTGFTGFMSLHLGVAGDIPATSVINQALLPTFTLTVARSGFGSGTVTSLPSVILCGNSCLATLSTGQVVVLHAIPATGSRFSGWSGDADCLDGSVSMSGDRNCVAQFDLLQNDFNGDRKSDITWQHSDGRSAIWLMNGLGADGIGGLLGPGTGWTVKRLADFNGDGKTDVAWQHADGTTVIWLMDGLNVLQASGGLVGAGSGWTIRDVADFNGDGKSDIAWQNTEGSSAIWLMNGLSVIGSGGLLGPGTGWNVHRLGDFNGDGKSDILWQHTDGTSVIWLMDGVGVMSAGGGLVGAGSGWTVWDMGDFNGDGKSDIVWQNTDGSSAIWLMNGLSPTDNGGLVGAGTGWSLREIGDFNGDGKRDLFWQHSDGNSVIWLMNGVNAISASGGLVGAGSGWTLCRLGDFNADGKSDIIWQNTDGSSALWLMDGFNPIGGSGLVGPGTGWSPIP